MQSVRFFTDAVRGELVKAVGGTDSAGNELNALANFTGLSLERVLR